MNVLREQLEALFRPAIDPRAPYAVQMFNELEKLVEAERAKARPEPGYNVLTDEDVAFPPGLGGPVVAGSSQLRMRAIEAAVQAVKAGAAFDVIRGAERYVAFALGQAVPEAQDPRPFRRRLFDLLEEEVHLERTDLEKLRHDVSEVFGQIEDAHWPKGFAVMSPEGLVAPDGSVAKSGADITEELIAAGVPQSPPEDLDGLLADLKRGSDARGPERVFLGGAGGSAEGMAVSLGSGTPGTLVASGGQGGNSQGGSER